MGILDLVGSFPAFGGKRDVAAPTWRRFGRVKQYIEPCCFSAAVLLLAPAPAALEVIGDLNGFVANFWRSVKHQPAEVARWADYPVSHIDLGARHVWLMQQRDRVGASLQDPDWPGDPKVAGWWLWGQCCWIGSGWCEWEGKIPHVGNAGMGVQAMGQIPHVGNAGRGELLTSSGRVAWEWMHRLAERLERVRVIHGDWTRTLNHHYGGDDTAIFFDPPYEDYEQLYNTTPIAQAMADWCREHPTLRVALCGHVGDYELPGWEVFQWSRKRLSYGGASTKDAECIWFSPACLKVEGVPIQTTMFAT